MWTAVYVIFRILFTLCFLLCAVACAIQVVSALGDLITEDLCSGENSDRLSTGCT